MSVRVLFYDNGCWDPQLTSLMNQFPKDLVFSIADATY